jgi:hypothetical protein
MIIIIPNVFDGKNHARAFSSIPSNIRSECNFAVAHGMVIKNNGKKDLHHVGEAIIEESDTEYTIRLKKIIDD